jgi:hypothetical protein
MGAKIGNLSCVLQHLGMLTPTGKVGNCPGKGRKKDMNVEKYVYFLKFLQVNINFIQRTFWEKLDLGSTLAGQDPEFRAMMTTRVTDCYDLSNVRSTSTLTST